ncbi:hypothetical protein ASPZODRAFT_12675 [Penicilliopsis zonata CBS 506.65]|uniref:Trafficking protein particle complex subunit 11 domain-containing protein n=1 Tax=Penicilliopsis zonata CBS 506.65 TaxID=1073090 RepID=A0A1L9SR20_9EURO|nr:hypothetical protein ASPZODRAFT_12675 [Penicilliopsis zonata CBS 506.65]OJJ49544.1 hypothetical protein ASPZODRAFT_12675 [Penicilliopsis zonata CBS 506.65]
MDAYPEDYVAHNLPLILLSGLEAGCEETAEAGNTDYPLLNERGSQIYSDFPSLSGTIAEELRTVLMEEDASQAPWNSRNETHNESSGIRVQIKSIGRSFKLPPRKADPPTTSRPASPTTDSYTGTPAGIPWVLHSPISPLTPKSPTFPDGLLTPLWVTKHQKLVPSAVVNFFPFSLDSNMNSLRDNQLKIEINELRKQWFSSGFKTRFLVVFVSEDGREDQLTDVDDRVAGIRRATNLDPRSIFFISPGITTAELRIFASALIGSLQPWIVEYYRDLSKHARRKRNRSTIPPPTAPPTSGTSQTLSVQGWNMRYEFKLGIFAEFRQEMDAACRNYESAYETLFGQEVFENIAGWSPRFNDARLLADSLAIRIIRCQLWTGQTTAAVRSWVSHRYRSQGVINRRGKGTKNYGWEAWEARWSMVMAQLIRRAEIPSLSSSIVSIGPGQSATSGLTFAHPEKTIPSGEPISPWEHLHHEGYWLSRSAKHSKLRRNLARQIPEEDRIPPGQSPASQIANKFYMYDTYLAPETHVEAPLSGRQGFDHSSLIIDTLNASLKEFSIRNQRRMVESLTLEIAEEYIKIGSWSEAFKILQPMWSSLSWRNAGWWRLMERFGWALRECAFQLNSAETVLRVDWELLSNIFKPRPDWTYDMHKSLKSLPSEKPKPSVVLRAEDVVGCLTASLVFEKAEGNVGEPLQVQLVVSSNAHSLSGPISLSEIKIVFEGCLRPVKLQSDHNAEPDTTSATRIASLQLREQSSSDSSSLQSPTSGLMPLVGLADLTISPSQTKVFDLTCIPRESGEARVASITLLMEEDEFDLAYAITTQEQYKPSWWQQTSKGPARRRVGMTRDPRRCKILPKPPKIRITTPNLRGNYYTNEQVALRIMIQNEEEETVDVSAEIRLFGRPDSAAKIQWPDELPGGAEPSDPADTAGSSPTEGASHFLKRSIGVMNSSATQELVVILRDTNEASDFELEVSALYNLVSDAQTPIVKVVTVELTFIRPFEANYEFLPRIHPEPWPDFFHFSDYLIADEAREKPDGLQQRWCLNSKVVSFAKESLIIEKISLVLLNLSGGAVSTIGSESIVGREPSSELAPEGLRDSNFDLDIQKLRLADRRPTSLDLELDIQWRRPGDSNSPESLTTTTLAIPRFLAPMGEPRVLASSKPSPSLSGLIHIDYTIENPSLHFLTFNLTMEASEQFAFSGPKSTVVKLVPLSRHTVRYNLLAFGRGLWIQPQLVVVDAYFNKTLRVLPTEEMRSDKKGILVWVDADD